MPIAIYRANETGLFRPGQVPGDSDLERHSRRALRLERRTDREKRQPFQLRSHAIQLRRRIRHHHQLRLHHRRQQCQRNQGREQDHTHRPPVGHCSAAWHRVAARRCSTRRSSSAPAAASTTIAASCLLISRPDMRQARSRAAHSALSQTPPFVTQQHCPYSSSFQANDPTFLYLNYIPICGGDYFTPPTPSPTEQYSLASPWGATLGPGPVNPTASRHLQLSAQRRGDYRRHRDRLKRASSRLFSASTTAPTNCLTA